MSEKTNTEKIDETFQKISEIEETTETSKTIESTNEIEEIDKSQDLDGSDLDDQDLDGPDLDDQEVVYETFDTEPQEVEHNTYPDANALNEDMMFLVGTGISGESASAVNDGYVELSLAAINAGNTILGPSEDGVFDVPEDFNDVSTVFAVTVIDENFTTELLRDYVVELTLGYTTQSNVAKLRLNSDLKWQAISKPSYILNDSFENDNTIQNVTRVKFMKLADLLNSSYNGLREFYELSATHKINGKSISVRIETLIPESSVDNELENLLDAEDRFSWDIIGRFLIDKDYENFYLGLKALSASNANQVRILEILAERYENQTETE